MVDRLKQRGIDRQKIEHAVREILEAIGEDPGREGLIGTPSRVAEAYEHFFSGLRENPAEHLEIGFTEGYDGLILVRDISLYSMCEHHLVPFIGRAHVGYIPDRKVVGISKIARLVEGYARRPQLQERLTEQIADDLYNCLAAKGSIVVIEAEHLCMTARGVQKPGSITVTSALRGVLFEDAAYRAEALDLIRNPRRPQG
ncbi:GTP cyclohydrolase I FolE [Rubrobacter calidifluminis]|uniref:GTP cyclohydrolase I FolE n=1 Tax=Rubrobacter calidifluminis TaxID=1392640 RepID=UPI0023626491|nr:GTP cyclohydrolase I FolE [Rubrobacter calidifluminis]